MEFQMPQSRHLRFTIGRVRAICEAESVASMCDAQPLGGELFG
jgi:hypothetical protein